MFSDNYVTEVQNVWYIDTPELFLNYFQEIKWLTFSEIKDLFKDKKIADIGSWFWTFPNYLKNSFNIKDINCIDPVYGYDNMNFSFKKTIIMVKDIFNNICSNLQKIEKPLIDWDSILLYFSLKSYYSCLENWLPDSEFKYYENLDSFNKNLDYAFSTELFRELPDVLSFLEDVFESLNEDWKFIIFDKCDKKFSNINFLHNLYNLKIINLSKFWDNLVCEFWKKSFLDNFDTIVSEFNKYNFDEDLNTSRGELSEKDKMYLDKFNKNIRYSLTELKEKFIFSIDSFDKLKTNKFPYWSFDDWLSIFFKKEIICNYEKIKKTEAYKSWYFEIRLEDWKLQIEDVD